MGQVDWERTAEVVRSSMHSGFLADAGVADTDFVTNAAWANFFNLGRQPQGQASITVLTATVTAGTTVTIGGVTLTSVAVPRTPGSNNFNGSAGSATLVAADIIAAINDPANGFTTTCTAASTGGSQVQLTAISFGPVLLTTSNSAQILIPASFSGGEQDPILWANVNGWIIPVTGTMNPNGVTGNRINLFPPPASDSRIDFVFLEVWLAQLAPNPSTANKPSATTIWKYGNVMFGGTNEPDDLEDPAIGFETTERVQLQYRLRVYGSGSGLGASVNLAVYPDGLGDPNVVAQGTAATPLAGFPFLNMREALGDPGLWRAGDGVATNALGTVDGYVYAIPVAAVFRRNTLPFVAVATFPGVANQNGSVNRNPYLLPVTNPAQTARILTTPTLSSAITLTTAIPSVITVSNFAGSFLDNPAINPITSGNTVYITINDEIFSVSSINVGTGQVTLSGRAHFNTQEAVHNAGTPIGLFNFRPDGLYADQIAPADVLDLRRSVTLGEWDHEELLLTNLTRLFKNDLRTSYKQSGVTGGDVEGVVIPEVDYLAASGAVP
ncbi:MAG: hypothetical protein EBU81_10340, partial [Proteobacteria bacterium]|nr:hypothetical protein [Pseudomonadota bacterium]